MMFERISDLRVVRGFGVCVLFEENGGGVVRSADGFDVRLTEREAAILEALIEVAPVRLPGDNGWMPEDGQPVKKATVLGASQGGTRAYESLCGKLPGLIDSKPGRAVGGVRLNSFVLGYREDGSLVVPGPWRERAENGDEAAAATIENLNRWAQECEEIAELREERRRLELRIEDEALGL